MVEKIDNRMITAWQVNNGILTATKSPLGSCGLFTVREISSLKKQDRRQEILIELALLAFNYKFNRPDCLALDNKDNFERYKDFITPYIKQENPYFKNPKGGLTKLFVIDCYKITKELLEKALITEDDVPNFYLREENE